MRTLQSFLLMFSLSMISACSNQAQSAKGTPVINLRNNSELSFNGKSAENVEQLAALLAPAMADELRRVETTNKLAFDVDSATRVAGLRTFVDNMNGIGFTNLDMIHGDTKFHIPQMVTQAVSGKFVTLNVQLLTNDDGQMNSIRLIVDGDDSITIEEANPAEACKQTIAKIAAIVKQEMSLPEKPEVIAIELKAAPAMSAKDFAELCVLIDSYVRENKDEPGKIEFWPFGYPSEEPPSALNMDEF